MARVSPKQNRFSRGQISKKLHGSQDLELYYTALEICRNYIVDGRGMLERRPGTRFYARTKDDGPAFLFPFAYSTTQAYVLELGQMYMRAIYQGGLVLDGGVPFEAATPYSVADLPEFSFHQLRDVLWMAHRNYPFNAIRRVAADEFSISPFDFRDGPYLDINATSTFLTPVSRGSLTPIMTTNNAPSGVASDSDGSANAFRAFDGNADTFVVLNTSSGFLAYQPAAPAVVDSYFITAQKSQVGADRSPYEWVVEGFDGVNWIILDSRKGETNWNGGQKKVFSFNNDRTYSSYRLRWTVSGATSSDNNTLVAELGFNISGDFQTAFTLFANSVTSINNDTGFSAADVGRLIRVLASDNIWRYFKVISIVSPTQINVVVYGPPLPDVSPMNRWRLGAIYGGNYPTVVGIHENRLVVGVGNRVLLSVTGDYDNMAPTQLDGTVIPDSAINVAIPAYNSKRGAVSDVNVLKSYDYQLFVGTPAGNFTIQSNSFGEGITSENVTIRPQEGRGAGRLEPEIVGSSVLFLHNTKKKLMGTYEKGTGAGRLGVQDLSLPADDIANRGITWLSFQEDPHGVLWCGLADGGLAALTIQPEEKVQAWHEHMLGGHFATNGRILPPAVESGCVITGDNGTRDVQHFVVKRTIGGQTRRFIEGVEPYWAVGTDLKESFFLDGALKYDGNNDITATLTMTGSGPTTVRTLASTNCPAFTAGTVLSLFDGRRWQRGIIETVFGSNDLTWSPIAPNAPPGPPDGRRWFFVDDAWVQLPIGAEFDIHVATYEDFDQTANIWKWSVGLSTLTGLDDYEGEYVDLLVDGVPMMHRLVTDGSITGIANGTIIVAGFHAPTLGKLLSIEAGSQNGSAQNKQRPVYEVDIDVLDSRGLYAGTGMPSAYDMKWAQFTELDFPDGFAVIEGEPLPAHTGFVTHTRDENFDVENPAVAWQQMDPLPSFIRGIITRLSESDGK